MTPGTKFYQQFRIVNDVKHAAFHNAYQARNLLEDDHAYNMSHLNQICALFEIILTAWIPLYPTKLREKYKLHIPEDIFRRNWKMNSDFKLKIHNEVLLMIGDLCLEIVNKVLN